MILIRRAILALALMAGLVPAFAQAPPPVPALPDTERRTTYSITGTTCACAVNFALYGDSTDYQDWVEVFLNGVRVNYNDATFGWTITSPTGSLATIPRPITDAVLTFSSSQTGTVQIVGARRPRRTSQFSENRGVAARDLNQALTDVIAQNRETWDKTNDITGRALLSQPGNTLGLLPLPSACVGAFLGFDGTGLNPVCRAGGAGSGNVTGPASSTTGHVALWNGASGNLIQDGGSPSGWFDSFCSSTIGQFWVRESGGWGCTSLGYANPVWWGADPLGVADSASAFNSALAASTYIKIPPGKFKLNSAISYTMASGFTSLKVEGSGVENTKLFWPNASGGMTVTYNGVGSSTTFQDLTFTTGQASGGTGLTLSLPSGGAASDNVPSFMYRVSFRGDDGPISGADYWTTGLSLSGVSEFNSDSVWVYGSATALAGTGAVLTSTNTNIAGVFNFTRFTSQFSAIGVNYGANIQGVTFDESNFTDDGIGISVPAGATNSLQLSVTNSQFAPRSTGILIQTAIQTFISNNFIMPGSYAINSTGISLAPDTACVIVGNVFQLGSPTFATNSLGLNLSGTGTANCNVIGNVFSALATGLGIQSTSGHVNAQGNTFIANTTAIVNASAAPNNFIANNPGYNPVGPAGISVGSSPFTYVAGPSPETVYIFGGTITNVTYDKNGGGLTAGACTASVAVTAQCTIELGPNETLKVTYTAAPGMNKMIH